MPTTAERARQADALRALHHTGRPLVLANAWDAKSARLVVAAGFPVVATSSGALVTALGYTDGSNIPVDEAFAALARITAAVEVPVTADIEDGYGLSADELAGRLLDAGAVGCNLEDSDHGPGDAPLVPAEQFAERVAALRTAATGRGVDLVINARVDVHLRQAGPPEGRLDEALRRSRLYVEAGAACVYPIIVSDEETARALVAGTPGPVNLMARPDPADVVRLASFGVTRISVGSGLSQLADQRVSEVADRSPGPSTHREDVSEAHRGPGGAERHRVVIIGCGFGGLFAARALRKAPVDVTVIDRTNHHLFQPLLYQVATGILSEGEIAPAIRDVLRRHRNVLVHMGEVTDIDVVSKTVTSVHRDAVTRTPYDSLIVAPGTHTSHFGHDEFARWATGLKSIDDALEARSRIVEAFELAESEPDEDRRRTLLTFAVVGAGPTGVEMAGQIIELSRRALRHNFRVIDPATARVLLFDAGASVLSFFGERIGAKTRANLTRLGVEVHLTSTVTAMDEDSLTVRRPDGTSETFAAHTKVWAAGVSGSPLGAQLAAAGGVELDRLGRVPVGPACTLPGHPEVFVVGDLMTLGDLPGMAEVAMQSGRHAARTIVGRLEGRPDTPLRYRDLGSMATISRFSGVAMIGPLRISGFFGWVLWLVVHLTFLTGFKNRVSALARWTISFVGRGRSERTITIQQLNGRTARARGPDATGGTD